MTDLRAFGTFFRNAQQERTVNYSASTHATMGCTHMPAMMQPVGATEVAASIPTSPQRGINFAQPIQLLLTQLAHHQLLLSAQLGYTTVCAVMRPSGPPPGCPPEGCHKLLGVRVVPPWLPHANTCTRPAHPDRSTHATMWARKLGTMGQPGRLQLPPRMVPGVLEERRMCLQWVPLHARR
jgi:hypothetical protein